jgi:outer membrane protein assembly factor BamB
MGHHRCHRNKATEKYLVLGRDGTELVDVATGKGDGNPWVRGSCQYGVMPCNGLIYAPSHSCACHIESKLNGFNALASAGPSEAPPDDDARLERGPAYRQVPSAEAAAGDPSDWPTLRHDSARSGRGSCVVAPEVKPAWETGLPGGRLSSPVVAEGKVLVASIDAHAVSALDARKGDLLWTFTAGGRIDSPPTIYRGAAVFGSADGWIYCLRATDGKLAWRFRAAPRDRRIVSYDQVESAWPVHGSMLVEDGIACAVAGRSAYLDGGMALLRLDAATGEKLSETPITEASLPDVLSSDGASIYLRHKRFSKEGVEQPGFVPHLYSPAGFLDDSWWHRTYWLIHAPMRSDWGGWPIAGGRVPAGRILAVDDATVYGFGRLNQYDRNGSHVGLGRMRYLLFASENPPKSDGPDAGQAQRRGKGPEAKGPTPKKPAQKGLPLNDVASRWAESVPVLVRAMVLGGETLWIAGPPDRFTRAPDDSTDPYASTSADALREQAAALAGQRGGLLWAVSTGDGKRAAEYRLPSPPVFDGMAAAGGRLYLVTQDGKVRCFGQDKAGE